MSEPSSAASMVGFAATAVRNCQKKLLGYPIGGRLLVTELTRDGMSMVRREIPSIHLAFRS